MYGSQSERTKRYKRQKAIESVDENLDGLLEAAQRLAHRQGKSSMFKVIQTLRKNQNNEQFLLKILNAKNYFLTPLNPVQALSLMIELRMSTRSYKALRKILNTGAQKLLPEYKHVRDEKKKCYPNGITVTESTAEVSLKNVVEHTILRLKDHQLPVLEHLLKDKDELHTIFYFNAGVDGSTNHPRHAFKFKDKNATDQFMLATSMNYLHWEDISKNVIWHTPAPASIRFNRPIKLENCKETREKTKEIYNEFKRETEALKTPFEFFIGDKKVVVHTEVLFCMIDGKVFSAITDTGSSITCQICGANPTDMVQFDENLFPPKDGRLLFGASPLHALLRLFDFFLDLGYRGNILKYRFNRKENPIYQENKKKIQDKLREHLGILVDVPDPRGRFH